MHISKTTLIIFVISIPIIISCGIGSDSNPITTTMVDTDSFENLPILSNVIAPDSISRTSQDTSFLYSEAHNSHDFGIIDTVYFMVTKPDGTSNGTAYLLRDNGLYGDSLAGDGKFTLGITSYGSDPGHYVFTFGAKNSLGFHAKLVSKDIILY